MGGRHDFLGFGTSFEAKNWRSLDCCGLICVQCSLAVHIFAYIILAWHLIEGSLFSNIVFLLVYTPVTILALSSLYMAWSTDPGAVPMGARPLVTVRRASSGEMTPTNGGTDRNDRGMRRCHKCHDNFKPTRAHHDAVTGRCIVKFDHYCPWVGNAVGAMNHKFFVLFIFYTCCSCLITLFLMFVRAIQCGYVHESSDDERLVADNPLNGNETFAGPSMEHNTTEGSDSASNIENQTNSVEDQNRQLFRMLTANYVAEECRGWHESYSVLILFIISIVFLIFTCCMLVEQVEAIETNASKIARMKMRVGQAGTELSRVTEEFNEMFGGAHKDVAWHWFLPLPVEFPRGMKKVVLGYEWDISFDPVPYGLDDEETGNAVVTSQLEESRIELTTQTSEVGTNSPQIDRELTGLTTSNDTNVSTPPPNDMVTDQAGAGAGLTKRTTSSISDEPRRGLLA